MDRGTLFADTALTGRQWCLAHSAIIDAWLRDLFQACDISGLKGLALTATGGYGRSELCPHSDIDVVLLHDGREDVAQIAERLWYPIWNEAIHLGHSVATVQECLRLAAYDLDTATAFLSARHVAGDPALTSRLVQAAKLKWKRNGKTRVKQLFARVTERQEAAGEVAFLLEPDLKEGRGGLRDVHSLLWAEAGGAVSVADDKPSLETAYSLLLDVRVELQRITKRANNLLTLQDQDAVAAALHLPDADTLMARVSGAARTIAWISDDTWRRIGKATTSRPLFRLVGRHGRPVSPELTLIDKEIRINSRRTLEDPALAIDSALAAARNGAAIERASLDRLSRETKPMHNRWKAELLQHFEELLLTGQPAIRLIEALDQRGVWTRIIPEWEHVRGVPQRNAYHRFTVDRHLIETAANAASIAERVSRTELLVVAALLHDIGKGHPGDHSSTGAELMERIAHRMGFPHNDVSTLVFLIENHLLLADVATRRDLDDPASIERVAKIVETRERLDLLAALTEADSVATGPAAWGPWKAQLVAQLVERVTFVLTGGDMANVSRETFPTTSQLDELASGEDRFEVRNDVLTIMTADRPGMFSRVAGVLALNGLDVLAAAAYSNETGRALEEFKVRNPFRTDTPWPKVLSDLKLALDGRLAVQARVAERARTYRRRVNGATINTTVSFDTEASPVATIIDVRTADAVGVLYRITRAMADLELDIRSAKVETLGDDVIDSFYVRNRRGEKIVDPETIVEIEKAILDSLAH